MKSALIHDWLDSAGGAERVLTALREVVDADLYTLVDHMSWGAKTSFIQKLPFAKSSFRFYFPFFPMAIRSLNLSEYDLLFSSSWCVAKGVRKQEHQTHVCYCHTPMRLAWDETYLDAHGLRPILSKFLSKLRAWDLSVNSGVDHWIANSHFIKERIAQCYNVDVDRVIYPPVDVEKAAFSANKENYFVTASRHVPSKKIDLIVQAFADLRSERLIVIGDGPERARLEKLAGSNVQFVGFQEDGVMYDYLSKAKAFVFASLEDFGILPVEAQACGTPVIAYGAGGSLESVKSGIFFAEQSPSAIVRAIQSFRRKDFHPELVRERVQHFAKERFQKEIQEFLDQCLSLRRG